MYLEQSDQKPLGSWVKRLVEQNNAKSRRSKSWAFGLSIYLILF